MIMDNGYWVSEMGSEETRLKLQKKMLESLAARDRIGDRAFNEGRSPTPEEWAEMARYQEQYEGYCQLLNKFFQPPTEPVEDELEELLY